MGVVAQSWLENIFISPYQHQIHHSIEPKHFNKNMGSKFAIWDYLFGTLVLSESTSKVNFGIPKDGLKYNSFLANLINPFLKPIQKASKYLRRNKQANK